MLKDYYKILEVSSNSTKEEIKLAYRKLSFKWHPDKNPGKDTTAIMQELNEAFLILNDLEARKRYDIQYYRYYHSENNGKTEIKSKVAHNESQHRSNNDFGKNEDSVKSESNYDFHIDDEILLKWMENAKNQSVINIKEMLGEFSESIKIGALTFLKTLGMAVIVVIVSLIFFKSLINIFI